MNKIILNTIVKNERYASADGWVMERRYGKVQLKHLDYPLPGYGFWVVINPDGEAIDRSRYANDLLDKHGLVRPQ